MNTAFKIKRDYKRLAYRAFSRGLLGQGMFYLAESRLIEKLARISG